jgi:cytochrome c oxidase subunit 2
MLRKLKGLLQEILTMRILLLSVFSLIAAFTLPSHVFAEPLLIGAAHPGQYDFQTPASVGMERIVHFHNILLVVITIITLIVLGILTYICIRFREKANPNPSSVTHNTMLEIIWTVIPVLVLVAIAIPSLKLLYFNDRTEDAEMTLKVIGYQWYWGYEYPDNNIAFESMIIPDKDIKPGQLRLLEVDNRLVLPINTNIRIQSTAADVIHSWAMPAFGIKIDAVPGRLNETWVRITKPGVYHGQCSELCGIKHGFMPIVVEAVSRDQFNRWVASKNGKITLLPPGTTAPAAATPAPAAPQTGATGTPAAAAPASNGTTNP